MFKPIYDFALILAAMVLSLSHASAQYEGYHLISDAGSLKKAFSTEANKINSIKSVFKQEKSLSMLSEKINSEGAFYFKRSNKIRIEYVKPFQYLLILNQGHALIRDEQKETKIPAQASRAIRQVNQLLADVMEGKILDNIEFSIRCFEKGATYLLELTPRSKALSSIYQNINIFVDRKDFTVTSMEMLEKNGDKTVMKFVQKKFNADLPESLFDTH